MRTFKVFSDIIKSVIFFCFYGRSGVLVLWDVPLVYYLTNFLIFKHFGSLILGRVCIKLGILLVLVTNHTSLKLLFSKALLSCRIERKVLYFRVSLSIGIILGLIWSDQTLVLSSVEWFSSWLLFDFAKSFLYFDQSFHISIVLLSPDTLAVFLQYRGGVILQWLVILKLSVG